jgi:hypothetical protein
MVSTIKKMFLKKSELHTNKIILESLHFKELLSKVRETLLSASQYKLEADDPQFDTQTCMLNFCRELVVTRY